MTETEDARQRWMARRKREIMSSHDAEKGNAGPVELKDDTFDSHMTEYDKVVVDCWAEWCGPCKAIAPIINELAQDYDGKVSFGKLDVDENPSTARRLAIMGIPTLLFYRDGQLVERIVGAAPRDHIENTMRKVFQLN